MVQNCASHSLTLRAGVQESFQHDTNPKRVEASSQVLNEANRSATHLPSDVVGFFFGLIELESQGLKKILMGGNQALTITLHYV